MTARAVAPETWTLAALMVFTPWNQTTAGQAGALCGNADGYQHPDHPSERGPGPHPSPSGAPIDPYSFTAAVPVGVPCNRTTGT